jgi:pyruvate,water dikinase
VKIVGTDDADILLSNTSRDNELLPSLGPLVGMSKLARGEMSREHYLEQWGHRGPLEAELAIPRPLEDPDWLDRQLESFALTEVNVEAMLAEQRSRFDAAWKRLCERYPRRVDKLRKHLEKAAEANRMREAVRSELTRLIWVARTWALRAGDLTGTGDDVFFLTFEETIELLHGNDTATAYIPARRRTYERYKALPPYPSLIRGRFDPFQWAADPDRDQYIFDASGLLQEMKLEAPSENIILGMPGSAGRIEGTVRRLDTPDDWDKLLPGEILVTSQTNIGWTLIFPKVKAIVTDIGAPLSHAAVVARELGIPAVVNCGDATTRLHTGDRVRIDGTQGTVDILETT